MTAQAQYTIHQAALLLQDVSGIRWPAPELVAHLNDGQRAIMEVRPDATALSADITLVAGHQQTLAPGVNALLGITRNTAGRQRAIRQVERSMLDAVEMNWTSGTQKPEVIHFCHDLRKPREFIVYPPVLAGTKVEAVQSMYPADLPTPAGPTFSSVTGLLSVADTYANALLHFVLFRAWSKDAEFGGNAGLAQSHYALFKAGLGEQLQSTATAAPTS